MQPVYSKFPKLVIGPSDNLETVKTNSTHVVAYL